MAIIIIFSPTEFWVSHYSAMIYSTLGTGSSLSLVEAGNNHHFIWSLSIHVQIILSSAIIIESVDSISRDGTDTPIYVIHYKKPKISKQVSL